VLQPSDHLSGPHLGAHQELRILPVLGATALDAVLQMGSHRSRVERDNPLPLPADHPSVDAAQNTVGFLGCKSTLLAHAQLFIIRIPIYMVLLVSTSPSLYSCLGLPQPKCNTLHFALLNLTRFSWAAY